MKKILFAFLLSATAGVMSAQTIALEPETLDYGTVAIQSDGYRTFTVKNTGNKALVLSNVKPSCGCTATDFTQTPILPGQTGSITVHYNTALPGAFSKSIEVFSNDPEKERTTIFIKGIVDKNAVPAPAAAPKKASGK